VLNSREIVRRIGRGRTRVIAITLLSYGLAGVILLTTLAVAVLPMTATIDTIARSSADVSQALASTRDAARRRFLVARIHVGQAPRVEHTQSG